MEKVIYFERSDFDNDGNLLSIPDKTVMLMLHTDRCPHCIQAKPEYEQFAKETSESNNIIVGAIQYDEPEIGDFRDISKKISLSPGVPCFVAYKNGKKIDEFNGKRNKNEYFNFITTI